MITKPEIDIIFNNRDKKKWNKIIDVYLFLRENLDRVDDPIILTDYQRKFNYFYQVRRNAAWRAKFYILFSKHSKEHNADFGAILNSLFTQTGKIEASFASKFAGTIDPNLPIIDRHVLSYIGKKLPPNGRSAEERIAGIIDLHADMKKDFSAFLKHDPAGSYLIDRFNDEYKTISISPTKMLDFVLWQSGGKKK